MTSFGEVLLVSSAALSAKDVILKNGFSSTTPGDFVPCIVVHVYGDVLEDSGELGVAVVVWMLSLAALGLERSSKAIPNKKH